MIRETKAAAIPAVRFIVAVPLPKEMLEEASSWPRSKRRGAELKLAEGLARKESTRRANTDKHNCR